MTHFLRRLSIVLSITMVFLCAPRAASAGVPQWPQKHDSARTSATKTDTHAKPPKDHHEELGRGFDGSDLFCAFAAVRYRLGSSNPRASLLRGSAVRASKVETPDALRSTGVTRVRSVDSLPDHAVATHLSI
jgi:hypothetical protein